MSAIENKIKAMGHILPAPFKFPIPIAQDVSWSFR